MAKLYYQKTALVHLDFFTAGSKCKLPSFLFRGYNLSIWKSATECSEESSAFRYLLLICANKTRILHINILYSDPLSFFLAQHCITTTLSKSTFKSWEELRVYSWRWPITRRWKNPSQCQLDTIQERELPSSVHQVLQSLWGFRIRKHLIHERSVESMQAGIEACKSITEPVRLYHYRQIKLFHTIWVEIALIRAAFNCFLNELNDN